MNTRTLTKYSIYAITVLGATLLNGLILEYVKKRLEQQGYLLVLMDMLVVIIVFTPIFGIVGDYMKKFSKAYIKTSKKAANSSRKGLLIGLALAMMLLFALYAYFRHDLDLFQDVQKIL